MSVARDVTHLGQVFTPPDLVGRMLALRRNRGRVLEPSCGDGAFFRRIPGCVGIEIDPRVCPPGALNLDFFAYPTSETFATIIGNPPYVRFRDIPPDTRRRLPVDRFGRRANLFVYFIAKCLDHLEPGGEIIFVTPRDFLKATAARDLNARLYAEGTITDLIVLDERNVFPGYGPDCIVWRFERGNFTRRTNGDLNFLLVSGQLLFTRTSYPIPFADVFAVRVGAASGADPIFADPQNGNVDFVCSITYATGETRRMIYQIKHPALLPHKPALIRRRIRRFDESNWWEWGRPLTATTAPRIYVNGRTRREKPFFLHPATHWDGAVLALFPHRQDADLADLRDLLNAVDWQELGFRHGQRLVFGQRMLEAGVLPDAFAPYVHRSRSRS